MERRNQGQKETCATHYQKRLLDEKINQQHYRIFPINLTYFKKHV